MRSATRLIFFAETAVALPGFLRTATMFFRSMSLPICPGFRFLFVQLLGTHWPCMTVFLSEFKLFNVSQTETNSLKNGASGNSASSSCRKMPILASTLARSRSTRPCPGQSLQRSTMHRSTSASSSALAIATSAIAVFCASVSKLADMFEPSNV